MSPWTRRGEHVVIVFPRGTDLMEGILAAATEAEVVSGAISGIGAIEAPRLAWFDRYEKTYRERTFDGVWEIASLIGNVSQYEDRLRLHVHATVSGRGCHVRGGHLCGGIVGLTCEITLVPFDEPLLRKLDPECDLPLLDL